MTTGIAIFAYNRNNHLLRVLDALKQNQGIEEIYIFQDGLKNEVHRIGWENTKKVINNIDWCKVKYILSAENKGLAQSIISGINLVLEENESVIVLEDDCVPAPNFIEFMTQCFEKYKDNKRVYSVSGYSWPIDLPESDSDIYFCGRVSSWGWGTWKDRWEQYRVDNMAIKKIKANKELSKELAIWGNDLEEMLVNNIRGENDSWAVHWALTVIQNNGVCINPYHSLIQNIGMDESGCHCGATNRFDVLLNMDTARIKFKLLDEISILSTTQLSFAELYGSYSAINVGIVKENSDRVLVYGLGNFYFMHEKEINQNFQIDSYLDKNKHGWFAGKKIITPIDIADIKFDKLLIAIRNIQECIDVSKLLIHQYNIDYKKIELLHNICGKYSKCFQDIHILPEGNLMITVLGNNIKVCSENEFNSVYRVFVDEKYNYYLNNQKKDVVFDIGMNIGESTLYFLDNNKVEKVYGFEPHRKTYLQAQENLKKYLLNKDILEIYQYGISNKNEIRNTNDNKIEVCRASKVLTPIILKHMHNNIILKISCEGEEYCILEELFQEGLLGKIGFIILEWHGNKKITYFLRETGFSYWSNEKVGLVYAINLAF